MARFALSTGLRQANVTGLEWSQLDMQRRVAWIHPDQAKARKAIPVPLNDEAVHVIPRQLGKHSARVFTFKGKPVRAVNTKAWQRALRLAGIEDFRWHDLRAHVGELARASGNFDSGTPGTRRLGVGGDGAPVRSSGAGKPRESGGPDHPDWYKNGYSRGEEAGQCNLAR
jgi:integrase